MISRFLAAILFSSLASVLSAQSVVTATVQSASGGQPYASGNYQVSLVDASGNPLSVFGYQSQFSGTLSSSGSLSLPLFPNSQIQAGSQWQFRVCSAVPKTLNTPQPSPVASCFSLPVTIQGAGDISSTLAAAAPAFYACTQWSGSAWQGCGTGSSGSGTVNAGTTGQIAYYPGNGTAVSGSPATYTSSLFTVPNSMLIDTQLLPATDIGESALTVSSAINPSVDVTNFENGIYSETSLEGSHSMFAGTAAYFDLGLGNPNQTSGDTVTATEAIGLLGEVDVNSDEITSPDVAAVAGVWFPLNGTAHITRISAFWASPQGATGAQEAYGFKSDSVASMGSTRSAAFYSVDQGTAANNYGIYIAGGNNYLGPNLTMVGALGQNAASSTGGTCAMSTATSCTITIAHNYTTPVCIATQQSATLTGGAVGCTVSGTTVTITAAVANSETWGALVFGNPN